MEIKNQWVVYHGGYVIMVETHNNGFFLQKGVHHELVPIKSYEAKSVLKKTKKLLKL